jgi:hypothetical protein
MIEPFYLAAAPEPRTILGLRLRPFSLGHVILLHRVESVFVIGGVPDFNDLALSVFICSQTYADALKAFEDPTLPEFMKRWHDKLTGSDRLLVRLGLSKPKLLDFSQLCARFSAYITEHSKIPNYDFNPADFTEMHCPHVQQVKVALMRDMGFDEEKLLDRGWGLCLWDYVTLKAMAGTVKMISEDTKAEALSLSNDLLARIKSGAVKIPCQS